MPGPYDPCMAPRRAPLVLVLLLTAALAGCGGDGGALNVLGGAARPEPNATDAAFARAMTPHERETLAMAGLARTRAMRRELRKVARSMLANRPNVIRRLEAGGLELQREGVRAPRGAMTRKPADLGALRNAVSFDQRFMELMIRHLESAIAMAEEEQDRGGHQGLSRLATEILESHERELETLRRYLNTWYGEGIQPGEGGGGGEGEGPPEDGDGDTPGGPGGEGEGEGQPKGPPV